MHLSDFCTQSQFDEFHASPFPVIVKRAESEPEMAYLAAWVYLLGLKGVKSQPIKAYTLLVKNAEHHPQSAFALGVVAMRSGWDSPEQNGELAGWHWLQKSADGGFRLAQAALAQRWTFPMMVHWSQCGPLSRLWLRCRLRNDADACAAWMQYAPVVDEVNLAEGESAQQPALPEMFYFAYAHATFGWGVKRNNALARALLSTGAKRGSSDCLVLLARHAIKRRDYPECLDLLDRAMTIGSRDALYERGLFALNFEFDDAAAIGFFERAATLGHASAMRRLAHLYSVATPSRKEHPSWAIMWAARAANHGENTAALMRKFARRYDKVHWDDAEQRDEYSKFKKTVDFMSGRSMAVPPAGG